MATCTQRNVQKFWSMNSSWIIFSPTPPSTLLMLVENSPLNMLQYSAGPESLGRAVSLASLAASATTSARSNPDSLKRMSTLEERAFPAFGADSSSRMKSRSHHNLGELPESPEHRGAPFTSVHQRASSNTDCIAVHGQPERLGSVWKHWYELIKLKYKMGQQSSDHRDKTMIVNFVPYV